MGKEKCKMEQQNEKAIISMKQNFFGVISAFSILLTMVVSGYIIFFCRNITTSGNAEFTETVPSTAFAIAVIALLILDYMLISAYIRAREQNQAYIILEQNKEELLKLLEQNQDENQKKEICQRIVNMDVEIYMYVLKSLYFEKPSSKT